MRLGIQTWGSEGDIRPLLALGQGLRQAGHEVRIAISSIENRDYAQQCQQLGLEYLRVPETLSFDKQSFGHENLDVNGLEWTARLLETAFLPYQEEIFDASLDLCRDCDAVIGHFLVHPLKAAAQAALVPYISVTLSHGGIPTDEYPPGILVNRGVYANQLAWKLHQSIQDSALRSLIQDFWVIHKLPTLKHVYEYWTSDLLDLVTVSPIFRPEPRDWSPIHRMCGPLDFPQDKFTLPQDLDAFISAGPAPVFFNLGVLMSFDPHNYMNLIREAISKVGCRAIIHVSPELISEWTPNSTEQDGQIYLEGPVPHSAIFPHCSAVVHHGGPAISHSATRYGRPSLVLGFQDEEMFWGKQLEALGVADSPIIHQNLSADNLAEGLGHLLENQSYAKKAQILARKMAQEDGVHNAIEMIHQILPGYD